MSAGRQMVASFVLRLKENVSPGIDALRRRLDSLRATANRIGAIGAIVAGISFMQPIQSAAAFEQILRDTAITAGRTGNAVEAMIARQREGIGRLALETAQRSTDVAQAGASLIASGMDAALADRLLPVVARVATAANASILDIARTAFALSDGLRMPADQLEGGLASLVVSGREGRFELRAMAREIPSLTGALDNLQLRGRVAADSLGAFLQVAMRNAGTESQAANNFRQFLSRLNAPDFLKAAREMGGQIPEVMNEAVRRGINPVEAAIQEVRRITQGDPLRIGKLFAEEQSRDFFVAINRFAGDYIRIMRVAGQATPAIIDQGLADQLRGLDAQLRQFNERIGQLGDTVGIAFARNLKAMNDGLQWLIDSMKAFEAAHPGVIGDVLAFAGAGTILAGALGVLGVVLPAIGAGIGLIGGPIGLAAIAIVGAGVLIWRYWNELGKSFSGLWGRIKASFNEFSEYLSAQINGDGQIAWFAWAIRSAWAPLGAFFGGLLDGIGRRFRAFLEFVQPVIDAARRLFGFTGEGGAPSVSDPEGQAARRRAMGTRGAAGGFYAPEAGAGSQRLTGEIVVRAAPGTQVEDTRSSDRRLPITAAPDRGMMLAVP